MSSRTPATDALLALLAADARGPRDHRLELHINSAVLTLLSNRTHRHARAAKLLTGEAARTDLHGRRADIAACIAAALPELGC
jgi:hypothetical protein